MLKTTKERKYGRMRGGSFYRTRIGNHDISVGDTKEESVALAWRNLEDIIATQMNRVEVGVAEDGTVILAREYQTGCVEVCHRRGVNGDIAVLGSYGSSMGRLEIDGHGVTVREYLEKELRRYNECTRTDAA